MEILLSKLRFIFRGGMVIDTLAVEAESSGGVFMMKNEKQVTGNACICMVGCERLIDMSDDMFCMLHSADVTTASRGRKRIILTGTCWYELNGLWHLLSAQGYEVYRMLPGKPCATVYCDLIIVALSAEPIINWGRHLSWVYELRGHMSGKMLVLAPERLKTLKGFLNICHIFSGCEDLKKLSNDIVKILKS